MTDLLVEQFPKILDLKFTAQMEDKLDDIASAKEEMTKVLDEFYYPFQEELKAAESHMERVQIPTNEICHVCSSPMVLKFGKTGQFLGCSKYPECKATRPLGGQPRAEAVESEHACPEVRQEALDPREQAQREIPLLLRLSRVQGVVQHRPRGQSGPLGRRDRTQVREMRQADGLAPGVARRLPGLHGLPQVPQRAAGRRRGPPRPARQGRGRLHQVRRSDGRAARSARFVPRLYATIPSAAARPRSPTSSRTSSPSKPSPATAPRADLKAIPIEETCEQCGGPMLVRRSRRGFFLGCAQYPQCKGTKQPGEATLAKINEVDR